MLESLVERGNWFWEKRFQLHSDVVPDLAGFVGIGLGN